MTRLFSICLVIWAVIDFGNGVSTKIDFGDEEMTSLTNNSTKAEDEDVEVQHTIVVSTKLKNNNRRGIHNFNDGNKGTLPYTHSHRENPKEDSGEVPVINGYKAVDSTRIRTPDTKHKIVYPDSMFINRNIRDEYDIYPNLATNPMQWKPSNFFNNINSWNPDFGPQARKYDRPYQGKIHRKITEDSVKEFYCRRCLELSNGEGLRGCTQHRSSWARETTTAKIKVDGKLAKLN